MKTIHKIIFSLITILVLAIIVVADNGVFDNTNYNGYNIYGAGNISATQQIFVGNDTYRDNYINFYNDNTGNYDRYFRWYYATNNFYMNGQLGTTGIASAGSIYTSGGSNIYSSGHIFTMGSGDNLWLGTTTEGNALFHAGADGAIRAENITITNITIQGQSQPALKEYNSTCNGIYSPDGTTVWNICN